MASVVPVNPHMTAEARELLQYFYSISGKATISGQHNQPARMSFSSDRIHEITGHTPQMWGGEWGFADERHDNDNISYRPRFMSEVRRNHLGGQIICVTYHQGCPTIGEPCLFEGGVIHPFTEQDWADLFDSSTATHKVWEECVDRLAYAFLEFQSEGIPIVFRPYHEMNGDWFWWGGNPPAFLKLWAMIYDRFTRHHGLNNLIWAWTCDRPHPNVGEFFPGIDSVDLLGTDIYPAENRADTYPQEWFDRMKDLAGSKPMGLSENSVIPSIETINTQPYAWFLSWDRMVFNANSEEHLRTIFNSKTILTDSWKDSAL